jgi:hypothetical protein
MRRNNRNNRWSTWFWFLFFSFLLIHSIKKFPLNEVEKEKKGVKSIWMNETKRNQPAIFQLNAAFNTSFSKVCILLLYFLRSEWKKHLHCGFMEFFHQQHLEQSCF